MIAVSDTIREKPQWWLKYKDPEIIAKWRKEAARRNLSPPYRLRFAEVNYEFKELEWHAAKRQEQIDHDCKVAIDVGVEGTPSADGLIPKILKQRLLRSVRKLEDIPEHLKVWHP
ncbi:hypothetical protein FBU30_009719 [Linnemannia zychae]|nr:hypothetical protein FBU30_009719 [Linnemannia zychae]